MEIKEIVCVDWLIDDTSAIEFEKRESDNLIVGDLNTMNAQSEYTLTPPSRVRVQCVAIPDDTSGKLPYKRNAQYP